MKTVLVGDTHGDAQFVANVNRFARDAGATTIVQLGDFGYNFDRNLLASIGAFLDRSEENRWYWLDGNHDHHDYIEDVILKDQPWDVPVPHFHDRMFYCPRGSTTMLGDTKVMFLGGAFSIDRAYRKEYVSWWPQETIRHKDMIAANQNKDGVTVMFTHDAPPNDGLEPLLWQGLGYKIDEASRSNRENLAAVVNVVRPDRLYHGHYHHRYDGTYVSPDGWTTRVKGVAANYVHNRHEPRAVPEVNVLVREF